MAIPDFLDKLLDSKIATGKNYLIALLLLCLFGLNLLGFDILKISQIPYIITILLIANILSTILTSFFTVNKMNDIYEVVSKLYNISDTFETNNENTEFIMSKLNTIDTQEKETNGNVISVYNMLSGKPSLINIRVLLYADIKILFDDMYNEFVNYSLQSANTTNSTTLDFALNNLAINLDDTVKERIELMHKTLKIYDVNENLTPWLLTKINAMNDKLKTEVQLNKEIKEKLYIIYCIFRKSRTELEDDINNYLRKIQTGIYKEL